MYHDCGSQVESPLIWNSAAICENDAGGMGNKGQRRLAYALASNMQ